LRTPLAILTICALALFALAFALLVGAARGEDRPADEAVERNNRGAALLKEGKPEQAIAEFQQALEIAPSSVVAQANLAYAYERHGQTQAAIDAYRKVLTLDPDHALARNNLATLLSRNGLYDEAIAELEEAVRRDPGNAAAKSSLDTARRNKALAAEKQRRIAAAVKGAEARPTDPQAAYNAARVYSLHGDLDNAIAWLARALDRGFAQLEYLSVDPSLANLRNDPRFTKFLEERRPVSATQR